MFAQSLPRHRRIPQCFMAKTPESFRISFPYPSTSHPLSVPLFVAYGCSLATEQHLTEMEIEKVQDNAEENMLGIYPYKSLLQGIRKRYAPVLQSSLGMHINRMSCNVYS